MFDLPSPMKADRALFDKNNGFLRIKAITRLNVMPFMKLTIPQ